MIGCNKTERKIPMKPEEVPPDGLSAFFHKRFGGQLVVPGRGNPYGNAVDSNARVRGIRRVSDEEITAAVSEYYASVGMHAQSILEPQDLCFEAEGHNLTLVVLLSNFTAEGDPNSRILITVDSHSHV